MFTFKEYLELDILITKILTEDTESKWDHYGIESIHGDTVNGKRVQIHIKRTDLNGDNNMHHVSFKVNGSTNKSMNDPNTGKDIVSHVIKHVNSYIKDRVIKGDRISMTAQDHDPVMKDRKNHLYGMYSKRLASKLGGKYKTNGYGEFTLHSVIL